MFYLPVQLGKLFLSMCLALTLRVRVMWVFE